MANSDSSARDACEERRGDEEAHEASEQPRGCFYSLEGWVFLGSIAPDGEEVYETIRCRRCKGTGLLEIHY